MTIFDIHRLYLLQELETFMRGHDDKNKKKVEELAQSMLNNHIMVSTVTSELQEFKDRNQSLNNRVCVFAFSWCLCFQNGWCNILR